MTAVDHVLYGSGSASPLEHVASFLRDHCVAEILPCVSSFFASVSTSDAVWGARCGRLWQGKIYVPERFFSAERRIDAFWSSLKDAKRAAITPEELCAFTWYSRMKGCAGEGWTDGDPWWQGRPAAQRRYFPDGTTTSERGEGRWRFVPDTCGRTGPEGSFVRHSRHGREFPTHVCFRHEPTWGFVLQNCWGFSASFPLPLRGIEPDLEDGSELCLAVTVDNCREEANAFNMGLPLPHGAFSAADLLSLRRYLEGSGDDEVAEADVEEDAPEEAAGVSEDGLGGSRWSGGGSRALASRSAT